MLLLDLLGFVQVVRELEQREEGLLDARYVVEQLCALALELIDLQGLTQSTLLFDRQLVEFFLAFVQVVNERLNTLTNTFF